MPKTHIHPPDAERARLIEGIARAMLLTPTQKKLLGEMVGELDENERQELSALLATEEKVVQEMVADAAVQAAAGGNDVFLKELDAFLKKSAKRVRADTEGVEKQSDTDTAEHLFLDA